MHKHDLVFPTLTGFEHRCSWLQKPALNCCPLLTCLPAGHTHLISKNREEMTSLTVQTGLKVWTSCFSFFGPSHGSKEGIGYWTLNHFNKKQLKYVASRNQSLTFDARFYIDIASLLSFRTLSFKWQGQTSKELKEGSRSLQAHWQLQTSFRVIITLPPAPSPFQSTTLHL